jgi:meso-butanediol dehydrogenase / (S,S)-butanediol dehydrogenase / diacetyl reductase
MIFYPILGAPAEFPRQAAECEAMSFAKKVVLVTGSTSGIGQACARVFAESGASVMVSGRDRVRGEGVVAAICAAGGRAEFLAVDLRSQGACERLIADTIERLGALHVLVNNAGILYTATALDTSNEQWLDTMAVNVNALFYLSRAAVKHMKAAGGGVIVNVASEWGLNGESRHVAYCASKGAVIQITRCMALDHAADNIRVNSVCPGEIHTRMVDEILASRGGDAAANLRDLAAGIPMRRLAQPVEVARCVQFLASDQASYVTGTNLSVDGGNDATAGPYP